ncbi:MAG: LysE family transporter [Ginsengibacter sp.]
MRFIKIFFWGSLISFLGTLPLSNLNVTAMQISLGESIHNAMIFSLGTLTAEIIIVRIILAGIEWVRKQKKLFRLFEWMTFFIIAAFAAGSFIATGKAHESKNILLDNHLNRFILGMVMSLLNPAHIPFWFGWSAVLFSKNILIPKPVYYSVYIIAIGLGTFLANCIYIYGGRILINKVTANQHLINYAVGVAFAIAAIVQLVKIIWFASPMEKLNKANPV